MVPRTKVSGRVREDLSSDHGSSDQSKGRVREDLGFDHGPLDQSKLKS